MYPRNHTQRLGGESAQTTSRSSRNPEGRKGTARTVKAEICSSRRSAHLYFGKSLNPLKTSNLEVLEVLDRFRGIRTLEGLEVLRDIRPGCSTCFQLKQFYTLIVILQQRVKSELRVLWPVQKQNAIKQS